MRRQILLAISIVVLIQPMTALVWATVPSFLPLQNMGDGRSYLHMPGGVSNVEPVVAGGLTWAEIWKDGVIYNLGRLHNTILSTSTAHGITSDGSIVVGGSTSMLGWEAFKWENGNMVGLGDLSGGTFHSTATDISEDGSVIVGQSDSASGWQAFRWSDGSILGIGDLAGGDFNSEAAAVSADGTVIAGTGTSENGTEAFRWEDGEMTGLGSLDGGSFYSRARAMSADGTVIVGQSDSASGWQAFKWKDGVMTGLGFPPGSAIGSTTSEAWAVSGDGSIIVGSYHGPIGHRAFIWDEEHGMRSLEYVLAKDYGLVLGGWKIETATAISDDGMFIAGYGLNSDLDEVGYIATLSPCSHHIGGDNNGDCKVDLADLSIMASNWLETAK